MEPERSIPRRLFDLAWPVIGLNVLTVLSLAVDTAMCGRLPNAPAVLEALGFATQVVFLLMVAMMGLTVGTVAFVARAHGAGDEDRARHILHQSTQLTILMALGVAGLGNLFAPAILELLGARPEVVELGLDYLRPLLGFTAFYYLNLLYAAALRAVGNTQLAFAIALLSNGLNVLFNYGLILGNFGLPSLGVHGAAIGTVCSQAIGTIAFIVMIRRGVVKGMGLPLRPRAIDRELAGQLIRVGWPAALDMVILNAGFLSIIGMLGRLDGTAVAAHGVGLRVQALAFVPGLSVSQATGAMVGNALGAENVDEARSVVKASVVLCTAIMTAIAIVLLAGAAPLVGIFDIAPDTPLADLSIEWMRLLGAGMPIVGVHIALIGMLRGAGATNTSLWINIIGTAIQIPLSYVLGFPMGLGPFGVWLAFPLSFVVKMLLGIGAYRRGTWAQTGATV
ncbi:MAG: MATE family efflux transporter [Deltaproteobacteria bacterium]|nr:MATE family efflux transporter [Deltaproteobacteria bacterium]